MKDKARCTRKMLASSPIGMVEECKCGTVHLTLGALTVRLEREALRDLQGVLTEALSNLDDSEPHHHRPAIHN